MLVLSRLSVARRNAVLAFFSFDPEKVKFALENYRWRMDDGSTVINQLLEKYSLEGLAAVYHGAVQKGICQGTLNENQA